ncbi:uncharacterized protein LOC108668262 [Hyalella azteca]|uniref:Uncharacterized protein LOC108668262 n=1 Tax=Hyalella azteca TaxID=294128 RepID=A0A8B7NBG2_HYAAZ|nr:uncharacterized protein LOC108668262 [Hyalella azteca]
MNRALLLLVVAAASVSAAPSTCLSALSSAHMKLVELAAGTCKEKYWTADYSFSSDRNCSYMYGLAPHNVEFCDPIVMNYMKCILKTSGLLKADGSFDDTAFKKTTLQNKCTSDTKFSTAYQPCRDSTMKYLNYLRFVYCLHGKFEPIT